MLTPTKKLNEAVKQGYIIRRSGGYTWLMQDYMHYLQEHDLPLVEVRLGSNNKIKHCYVGADLYACSYRLGEHSRNLCRKAFVDNGCLDKQWKMILGPVDACHYKVPVVVAETVANQLVAALSKKMFFEPKEIGGWNEAKDLVSELDTWLETGYVIPNSAYVL